MAKVSLRIYNREIESLIDQGHLDEAIAHCRHILQTFPKHLETYRLLGKAYLEAKRYNEAVDIFNRVLMAVPDDFVSNVGMSIIRDEQNKLDDAIWHMERAYEAQPSNSAIQAELQRLYGRRDGVEPPKIRMTRGALAHMYVQGELYPQAISEIRAVLATDSQRADMQVLLARAFFRGGQKADASDMCAQLLKRYPYCFDANRIMVELLPASERAESTQVYRHRVNELDPYTTFTKESVFRSAEIPDASINLDRLEYKGQDVDMDTDWGASLGIGLSTPATSSEQPDWLKSGLSDEGSSPSASLSDLQPVSVSKDDSDIPDFLRDAGWKESNGMGEEPSGFDSTPAEDALTPANIPDWLKGQMPPEPAPSGVGERPTVPPAEVPDWLSGLDTSSSETPSSAEVPDWLSGVDSDVPTQPRASSADAPDWLSGLGSDKPTQPPPAPSSADVPDWLSGLDDGATSESAAAPASDIPDWLKGLDVPQAEEPAKDEFPIMQPQESAPEPQQPAQPAPEPEPVKPVPPASIESLGASSKEQDDAIAWLEMLAAKHGAKPEELVTDPAARSEKPPEWVEQARALAEAGPAAAPAEESQQEEATSSMDETGIWLRDLAEKEPPGTPAEEVQPAVEADIPDWLKGLDSQPAEEEQPSATTEELSPAVEAQIPDWLQGLEVQPADAAQSEAQAEQPVSEEPASAETPAEPDWMAARRNLPRTRPLDEAALTHQADIPDWLIGMDEEEMAEPESQKGISEWLSGLDKEPKAEQPEPAAAPPESADVPGWLSGLESKETTAEEQPAAKEADVPEWLSGLESSEAAAEEQPAQKEASVPDWLSGLEREEAIAEEQPVAKATDVPEWLSGLESQEVAAEEEPVAKEAGVPEWLSGLESSAVAGVEEETEEEPAEAELSQPLPTSTEEPAPVPAVTTDLPEWLRGLDQAAIESEAQPEEAQQNVPSWLKTDFEEEEQPHPAPVTPADWHPVEPRVEQPVVEPEPEPLPEMRQPAPRATSPLAEPHPTPPPPDVRKPARAARTKQMETAQGTITMLSQAQSELNRGDIPTSLAHYNKLIKKGKHLEEAIRDLRESLYRYPVEVGIWQTLGDAYMRANRLQEALDAYNKAEELLR